MNIQTDAFMAQEKVQPVLCKVVAEVLKIDPSDIDIHQPFLDMGASSLALIDVFRVVSETFGVRPSMRKVFDEYTTIELLSNYIIELIQTQKDLSTTDALTVLKADLAPVTPKQFIQIPLTEMQKQIWFLARYSEGASLAYNETAILRLSGPLHWEALQQAFQIVVNRHEALRTSLSLDEDVQLIALEIDFEIPFIDLSGLTSQKLHLETANWLAAEAKLAFEMDKSLFRASVLRLQNDVHLLVVTAHALTVDKRSINVILSEVGSLYSAAVSATEAKLEEAFQFRNYIDLLQRREQTLALQKAEEYWLEQYCDGIPNLDLPLDSVRPPVKSYRGSRLVIPLDPSLIQSLKSWSLQHGSTLFMTLLGALNVFLHRLTAQDDIVVGVFSRGEPLLAGTEKLVANAVNSLPLRTKVEESLDFKDYLGTLRETMLNTFDHQDYPFASLINKLNPERDQSRSVMFTVAFDMEPPLQLPQFANLKVEVITAPIQYTQYDLKVTVVGNEDTFQIQCDYSTDLFDSETIRRWMTHFKTLLQGITHCSTSLLHELPLLVDADYKQLLQDWNQTDRSYPQDLEIHTLFENQCLKTPTDIAVIFQHERWTYRELNERANQIGRYLQTLGVGAETMVGVYLERSAALVAGLLGVLKAGGSYVPLDPAYPEERLSFILQDAGISILLTQEKLRSQLSTKVARVVCLDTDWSEIAKQHTDNLNRKAEPDKIAYVMYTSGSTGKPKGVAIEHLSTVNFLFWALETFEADDSRGVLFSTSICFDLSVFELFFPLSCGGKLIVADNALHLPSLPAANEVILINTVPSAIAELLRLEGVPTSVRTVNLCGEVLTNVLAQAIYNQTSVQKVFNLYGPTESTTYSTFTLIEKGSTEPTTIGRPLANTKAYIVDRYLRPVPVGVAGELLLGGAGLAQGYLNRPESTTEKFIDNPFSPALDTRLYRTGDLVRYLPDGRMAYLGRIDYQVKIRGFRIELGEIESVLLQHPAVKEIVVVARESVSGDKRLVAYLALNQDNSASTVTELQTFLKQKLPEYMVPASFVILSGLPRTPNGKVDRKALPELDTTTNQMRLGYAYVAPRTPTEEILIQIWADILELEQVGIHDDFFALGGHSLLMTPLMLKIRQYFQVKLTLREFFAEPTVAALAQQIIKLREQQAAKITSMNQQQGYNQMELAVEERFKFLNREAELDLTIHAYGLSYEPKSHPEKVLVTGANGFVGSHLIHELLEQTDIKIYCLVRCSRLEDGKERIINSLRHFNLWNDSYEQRIIPVKGDLALENLGIEHGKFEVLAREIDFIIHNGALVNFIYPYHPLKPVNVGGTLEVIKLAFKTKIKPVHFVSTVAIWPMGAHHVFANDTSIDHNMHLNMAYDETKWVAEKLLLQARERGLPVTIYRPGEVSGQSQTGLCIPQHFIYAMWAGSIQLQALPRINCFIDFTPVDYVAKAIAYLALQQNSLGKAFHLTNPSPMHSIKAYAWLRSKGYEFEELPLEEWRQRLMNNNHFAENALYPYAAVLEDFEEVNLNFPVYDCQQTLQALEGSSIQCPPLDEKLLATYLDFFIRIGFLSPPSVATPKVLTTFD